MDYELNRKTIEYKGNRFMVSWNNDTISLSPFDHSETCPDTCVYVASRSWLEDLTIYYKDRADYLIWQIWALFQLWENKCIMTKEDLFLYDWDGNLDTWSSKNI